MKEPSSCTHPVFDALLEKAAHLSFHTITGVRWTLADVGVGVELRTQVTVLAPAVQGTWGPTSGRTQQA